MTVSNRFLKSMSLSIMVTLSAAWAGLVLGQDEAGTVNVIVSEHETYGVILMVATDQPETAADEHPVYAFVNEAAEANDETMTEGIRSNAAVCEGACLEAWPPVVAETFVASEGVNQELLYLEEMDGLMVLVYNGWPLYSYTEDADTGDVLGQGAGEGDNVWYLLDAEGNPVRVAAGGATGGATTDGETETPAGETAETEDETETPAGETSDETTDETATDETTDETTTDETTDETMDGDGESSENAD